MHGEKCRHCGGSLDGNGECPRCLLETAMLDADEEGAERLFQAALSYAEEEREAFVRGACADRPALREQVRLLMEGYAEAGGDAAEVTFGDDVSARAAWAAVRQEEPGTVIGAFRLIRLLGEGGMGSVWAAEQKEPFKRRVALKVIKAGMDTREVVARFQRERQSLALMKHPNIAQVFEAGSTELGRPYFAMELVNGLPINEHCETRELDLRQRLSLFLEVCGAVQHAHQKGVLHRDLKPTNVLVSEDGHPKVIDFGVAKAVQEDQEEGQLTRTTQVLGTPAYMSPEQATSDGVHADTRSDVYSLGVILYELLTGTLPFDPKRLAGNSAVEIQRILTKEVPPKPSARSRTEGGPGDTMVLPGVLHGDLDWVVMQAIAKEPERRYASAADLAADLQRYLDGELVQAVPPTVRYRFNKFVRRNRAAVGAVAAVILTLIAGLAVTLIQNERVNRALLGQTAAHRQATRSLADLQVNNGHNASELGRFEEAALWFAKAATTMKEDLSRATEFLELHAAWRQVFRHPVRAFQTGEAFISSIEWNPRHPVLLVHIDNQYFTQVWDLRERSRRWRPDLPTFWRAAWAPKGERLLVKTDTQLHVLAFPQGESIQSIDLAHSFSLAWHPAGSLVASGGPGGLSLWDLTSGELVKLEDEAGDAVRVEFSRDGQFLLVQHRTQTAIRAASPPFDLLHSPHGSGPASSILLGSGRGYVTTTKDTQTVVRDTATGEVRERYPLTTEAASERRWSSPDGRFLVRNSDRVIDRQQRSPLSSIAGAQTVQAAFSLDNRFLATGSRDKQLLLWSLPDGERIAAMGEPQTPILALAFSSDGAYLASAERGNVRVWDMTLPVISRRLTSDDDAATFAVLSPDGLLLAPSGRSRLDGTLRRTRVYSLDSGEPAGPLLDPGGLIMNAAFHPTADWLALAVSTTVDRGAQALESHAGSGNIQLWDYRAGRQLGDPIALPSEPRGLAVHPGGKVLGVSGAGGEGFEIDTGSGEVSVLFQHPQPDSRNQANVNNGRCGYSPDGAILAVWGPFQVHHLWHREERRELISPLRSESTIFDLDFHRDVVANPVVAVNHRIEFREVHTGREVISPLPHSNWPMLGRFDPSGEFFLIGGGDEMAQVWDWQSRAPAGAPHPHAHQVLAGVFLPRSPRVATGGYAGAVRFWNYRTGRSVRPRLELPGNVLDLSVSAATQTLVVGGTFSGLELVDLETAMPRSSLDSAAALRLAEIEAGATVEEDGGLHRLSVTEWFERWEAFRREFPGVHRMDEPSPGGSKIHSR